MLWGQQHLQEYMLCGKSSEIVEHSNSSYMIVFVLIVCFTIYAMIASGVIIASNQKSLERTKKLEETIFGAGDDACQTIGKIKLTLIQMQTFIRQFDSKTSHLLDLITHRLRKESLTIQSFIEKTRESCDRALQTLYLVNLVIVSVNLVLLVSGLGDFIWDTCSTMKSFNENPQKNNSLEAILPCPKSTYSDRTLAQIGFSVHSLITMINSKISEAFATNEDQHSILQLCDPFSTAPNYSYSPANCAKNSIPLGDLPSILPRFICYKENTSESCLKDGKFVPEAIYVITLAYSRSIQDLINIYPDLSSLMQCSYVKEAISEIVGHQCKPIGLSTKYLIEGGMVVYSVNCILLDVEFCSAANENHRLHVFKCNTNCLTNTRNQLTTSHCYAVGSKCSISTVVWTLVGFLLLYTLICRTYIQNKEKHNNMSILLRELEQVEEENIQMPPPRKRSPRATKRKPRRPNTLIGEFLDESSQIRHVFFPTIKMAVVNPMKNITGNDSLYYYPGRIWLDTDGNPIQAHGGCILYDEESKTYYWYGEYKDGPTYHAHRKGAARVDVIGVGCYSSKDLWTWKSEGIVLAADEKDETHDLHKLNVLERPKVIYNDKTKKYVMWMHIDDANYTKASIGVATSDSPTGPFNYLYSKRPHGFDSRDMTIFKDDDNIAYLIYSSLDNTELHIGPLDSEYLDVTQAMTRILIGRHREAPALFKHEGTYYMITSRCTGWAPNEALVHAAESIMGPWEVIGNPCIGGNKAFRLTTFFAQSTYVLPLLGLPGSFIFMADRWSPADLRDSRGGVYV
ncbi:hypothetical protein ACJIZ3_002076 [Penstemon smallii]|uniref:Uncharacterized protein n=1 Tax=Penstemon smallii TaxID=265156 RepID=A0ABD3U7Z5_9LAMI